MLRSMLIVAWGCLLVAGLGGCAAESPAVDNPLSIDSREYSRLFRATLETLREEGYVIDRKDFRFGRITVKPRAAATVLEPWFSQGEDLGQSLENTANNQRRLITVFLEPAPAPGSAPGNVSATQPAATMTGETTEAELAALVRALDAVPSASTATTQPVADTGLPFVLRVEVLLQRREMPDRRLAGSVDPGEIYRPTAGTSAELQQRGIVGPYWLTIGRDISVEQRLLRRIVARSLLLPAN